MSRKRWIRHPFVSVKQWRSEKRLVRAAADSKAAPPLREFVYLDAVSLHSLLVSQNATIPHEVTQAISRADEAEMSGSIGAKIGSEVIGGAAQLESSARYQTSNSNSMQSSRKAVIQTLFKELRELPLDFKFAARMEAPPRLNAIESIANAKYSEGVEAGSALLRGALIEVEVTLAVDPVFKLGTMMTEWSAMADEFPAMFGNQGLLGFLRDSEPIVKVLDRFLAGLIPIKATATNYLVAEVDGKEYVVHASAVEGYDLNTRPLRIAGVTEHIGYWKDIRRVLFSDARFTILGRIARDGIHKTWTPVKLADLFSDVAPDFVNQINAIRSPSASDSSNGAQGAQQVAFGQALEIYKTSIFPVDVEWTEPNEAAFLAVKAKYLNGATDASAQRQAFDEVRESISRTLELDPISPEFDLKARQDARAIAGLVLFPSFATDTSSGASTQLAEESPDERLLDVEVIAIYW